MKVVLGYIAWSEYARQWNEDMVRRARGYGWDVETFCLTPGISAPGYSFGELDHHWRTQQPDLVDMYRRLKLALGKADIFWNINGMNVHPAWLPEFDCLNLYGCFDDPESSARISQPVARFADACMVGNLSCGPLYESWGVRHHCWAPLAFVGEDYDPGLTPELVESQERPLPLVFFGERQAPWRQERLDRLAGAFPEALFYGRGWPTGYVCVEERRKAYGRARIGWNVHNSVGPVNLRFFALLANGVLQICDNKCRVGQVLKLEEEVIGFDSIEECIELTRYYLDNDAERRRIAANGLRRYQAEYTEEKVWAKLFEQWEQWLARKNEIKSAAPAYVPEFPAKHFSLGGRVVSALRKFLPRQGSEPAQIASPGTGETANVAQSYTGNTDAGGIDLGEKQKRRESGGHFERPDMVALNWACTKLVGAAERILELVGGTGCFAYEASAVPTRVISCTDTDKEAIAWAKANRYRENIRYLSGGAPQGRDLFDLVVAIDVIGHSRYFAEVIADCSRLAPRAIITASNKRRPRETDTSPSCCQHGREWDAAEFYGLLRTFYDDVQLYAMPDVYVPELCRVDTQSELTPLIAVCAGPRQGRDLAPTGDDAPVQTTAANPRP